MFKKGLACGAGIAVAFVTTIVVYAVASYPTSLASFAVRENGQTIDANWFNPVYDEVVAIEGNLLNGFAHHLKGATNNTYDVGVAGATFRDLNLGRNAAIGGTLSVTGATTVGDVRGTVETITATGSVNDQAVGATTTILRLNNATALTLTGLTGCTDGRILILESIGAGQVNLVHQSASSSAADRLINFATSGNTALAAGVGMAEYVCDGTTARWRLTRHEQGAWITPTFAAGDFTGSGGLTVTVAAGDVKTMAYRLAGRTLSVQMAVETITTGGAAGTTISVANGQWGGFTATKQFQVPANVLDATVESTGRAQAAGAATSISFVKTSAANWSNAATDTTYLYLSTAFEVN